MDINWDLVQFKYEFLGASLEDLAFEYSISAAVLKYNSKNWKQISLVQDEFIDMKDVKSLDDVLKKLSIQTLNQTQALQILKQKFLGPKYIEFETILLHKAISIASNISEKDQRSASILKSLTETLVNLVNQNPLLKSEEIEDGSGDKIWEVRVVDAKSEEHIKA